MTKKRIRSTKKEKIFSSPWNEQEVKGNTVHEFHDLADGEMQDREVEHFTALPCGHFGDPHALCSVCERMLCESCSFFCTECRKPIGRCCGVEIDGTWICESCQEKAKANSFWRSVFSPFFRFKDKADG